jgi:hypothetical protein
MGFAINADDWFDALHNKNSELEESFAARDIRASRKGRQDRVKNPFKLRA